jgi:hypothetical protein
MFESLNQVMEEKISAEFVELASVTSNGFKVTAPGIQYVENTPYVYEYRE